MATKKILFVVLLALALFAIASPTVIIVAFAQGNQTVTGTTATDNTSWFSWSLFITFLALGAFGGIIHDLNAGHGLVIMPHKTAQNTWDLGIITPALFGSFAGFMAGYAATSNVPFLQGLFPSFAGSGAFSALIAGYLYSKTIQVIGSMLPALSTGSTSASSSSSPSAPSSAPAPSPSSTPTPS